ncbi:hypothetical protein D3C72_344460 [compost metagenome]
MKATYSKSELKELAKDHFKSLGVKRLYATTDGQFFLNEGRCQLHAGSTHTVYAIDNEDPEQAEQVKEKPVSVEELKKALPSMSMEELQAALLHETAGANRKTATAAIEAQIAVLLADGRSPE